jgi:hypothetical protein
MARTPKTPVPPKTAGQLYAYYLQIAKKEQQLFCRLLLRHEFSDETSPAFKAIGQHIAAKLKWVLEIVDIAQRERLCAANEAAKMRAVFEEVVKGRQRKKGRDPKRLAKGPELAELKKRMSWRELVAHVREYHPDWIDGYKGALTPEEESEVFEYLRKIYRDYLKHLKHP